MDEMDLQPLVKALATGEAVAFVGAGASVSSGLPLWRKLLEDFLEYAKKSLTAADYDRALTLMKDGDFLLVAEVLQRVLNRETFESYLVDVFQPKPAKQPNDIHLSIARLPFSLTITTNFDSLLEAACRVYRKEPAAYTWKNVESIFDAIRKKQFAVVKAHGSVEDSSSLRLTRTQLTGRGVDKHPRHNFGFNDCLSALLTWKTFLFVGHSLRDIDLLRLLEEGKARFGDYFGPHFAILPRHEVEGTFTHYLWEALAIRCIPYDGPVVNLHKKTRDRHKDEENAKLHEKAIAAKLEDLAGLVAGYGQDATGAGVDAFPIPRKTAAQSLLDECVQRTGSIRGDVYMIESDVSPEFKSVAISRASDNEHPPELDTDSVTYTAFLHGKPTGTARLNPQDTSSAKPDYIYIRNTKTADKELEEAGHRFAHYIECNASVRSELAYPIVADGRRVGALNLESDLVDAYTGGHIAAARKAAEELGQIYLESERRRRASEPLNGYYQKPNELEDLLKKSHLTRAMNHDFILYEIDYENRRLKAHRANDSNDFSWPLDEKQSLARQVFEERRGIYIPDVQKELNSAKPKTKLNGDGVRHFNISGPLFACPVRARGQTEAVLVTWLKPASDPASKDRPGEEIQRWFQSSSAQASRLTNLLANDLYSSEGWRAKAFLERLCHSLTKIDGGWIWTSEMLDNPVFRDGITNALMEALLFEECGLRCVRIWQTSRKGDLAHERIAISSSDGFTCVDSLTLPGSKAPDKKPRKAYEEVWSCEDDEYCRYTIARFSYDPFAQWQHPKMFNKKKDANAEKLDKDPGGSWIVAPIVRPSYGRGAPELLGFISADSHDRSSGTPKYIPESDTRVIALQLRIMDLIAELARHVIAIDVPRSGTVGHG